MNAISEPTSNKDQKSFVKWWKNLTTIVKALYSFIIAIPVAIGAIITICNFACPKEVPPDLSEKIEQFEQFEEAEINKILKSCAKYNKNGLTEILNKFEITECRSELKYIIIDWFKRPENKFNNKKYLKIIITRSDAFFDSYIIDIKENDAKLDGVFNYIDLLGIIGKEKNDKVIKQLNNWKTKYENSAKLDTTAEYSCLNDFNKNIDESIKNISSN